MQVGKNCEHSRKGANKLKTFIMKTYSKKYLPESVTYKGETYKMNALISGAMNINNTSVNTIAATLKKEGRKAILITVLSNNLKGKTDLHGNPYKPTKFIFTND